MEKNSMTDFLNKEKEKAVMEKFASVSMPNGSHLQQDPYVNSYMSLMDTKIPEKMSELFKLCRYFYLFDPLVAGGVNALAGFPVTEVFIEESNEARLAMAEEAKKEEVQNKDDESKSLLDPSVTEESDQLKTYKRVVFNQLKIHKLLVGIGIDYWLYGNCFIFGEMQVNESTGLKEWKNMVRLDPSKITIDVNEATQEIRYKWTIPNRIKKIVKTKKPKGEYEKIPDMIKEAVKKNQQVVLNPNRIFHMARPTDSGGDSIWGPPVIANVMKLLLYRNTLRQAQEAIAKEHIVPFRVFYFEETNNVNVTGNWGKVVDDFSKQLMKSSRDPNYKVVSPLPVGVLNLGGQGKALMLTAEIEQVQAEILAGMGVPREFVFGGMSWSGSSISLKILENQFTTYRLLVKDFLQDFLVKGMAKERNEWSSDADDDKIPTISMSEIKMQDDVQQKQLIISLNQTGKLPDESVWRVMGFDPDNTRESLKEEAKKRIQLEEEIELLKIQSQNKIQIAQLKAQMELQRIQAKMQADFTNSDENKQLQQAQMSQQQEQMMQQQQMQMQQQQMQQGPVDENGQPVQEQDGGQQEEQAQTQQQPQQGKQQFPPEVEDMINALVKQLVQMPANEAMKKLQDFIRYNKVPQEVFNEIRKRLEKARREQQGAQDNQVATISPLDAEKIAIQLYQMSSDQREQALAQFDGKDRELIINTFKKLQNIKPSGDNQVDMRPLPKQKPPRRRR